MAISLASELLQSLLQFCIACLFRGLTVRRMAVMRQLQQACDGLLVGLGLRNLCQGWHCIGHTHGRLLATKPAAFGTENTVREAPHAEQRWMAQM